MAYRVWCRSAALVFPVVVLIVGCAAEPARTYYDDLEAGGGLVDGTVEGASMREPLAEASFSDDATGDDAFSEGPDTSLPDASSDAFFAMEAGPIDGAVDAPAESGVDSGGVKDAGCVMNNCGVCGQPTCTAGGGGCCPVTAANPSGCMIKHNGGYVTYYDCEAPVTDDHQAANDACTAYTGSLANCASFGCQHDNGAGIVCSQGSMNQNCICWGFKGDVKGFVDNADLLPVPTGSNCLCPSTTLDPDAWN